MKVFHDVKHAYFVSPDAELPDFDVFYYDEDYFLFDGVVGDGRVESPRQELLLGFHFRLDYCSVNG